MKKFKIIIIICFISFLKTTNSYSLIEIDITRGNLNPLPMAVSPLFQDKKSIKESLDMGINVINIICKHNRVMQIKKLFILRNNDFHLIYLIY